MRIWLLLILVLVTCKAEEVNLIFFQNDYDVKMDILECPFYNKSRHAYVEAKLIWYNRTQRAVNAKFAYLFDPLNNIFVSV